MEDVLKQINLIKVTCSVADETEQVTLKLLELLKTYPTRGKQIHDANLVATMLTYGIDTLLTLNIDDLKRFEPAIQLMTLP